MSASLFSKEPFPQIDEVINKMLPLLQDDSDGGFKDKEDGSKKGCFPTIEGLYPLLIHPQKEKWKENIINGIKYLLKNTKNGYISPAPEYPNIVGNCCVDSMAYGLYVLTLARHYVGNYISRREEQESILSDLNGRINQCIKYIEMNQNIDGGWPIVKDEVEELKSRTYSTALVIFSLNNCEGWDFEGCQKTRVTLIREGVIFLAKHNRCKEGGWFFSQPREKDAEEVKRLKTKMSLNLSAVVLFSLGHLIRAGSEFAEDDEILAILHDEANYIYSNIFEVKSGTTTFHLREKYLKEDYELVDYPIYDEHVKGKIIQQKEYYFPYEMLLPAFVITPGYSTKNKGLKILRDYIYNNFTRIAKKRIKPWKLYDFSDKVFAILYYDYIDTLLEESIDRFVRRAEVIRCAIDSSDSCLAVINASNKCLYSTNVDSCPHVSSTKNRLSKIGQTISQIKKRWIKSPGWLKAILIQIIVLVVTLFILIHLEKRTSLGSLSITIWTVYGIIQTLVFAFLLHFLSQKDQQR